MVSFMLSDKTNQNIILTLRNTVDAVVNHSLGDAYGTALKYIRKLFISRAYNICMQTSTYPCRCGAYCHIVTGRKRF